MRSIVFDTDILSTFAKANGIQHLQKLFAKDRLLITSSVYSELKVPKEYGSNFPDQIFNSDKFELVQLNSREIDEFKSKLLKFKTQSMPATAHLFIKRPCRHFSTYPIVFLLRRSSMVCD